MQPSDRDENKKKGRKPSEGESGLREKSEEVGKIDSVTVVLSSRLSTVKSTIIRLEREPI